MSQSSILPAERIDRAELAQALGYHSTQSVARAHRRGTLPLAYVVVAGRAIYSVAEVKAYIQSQRREPRGRSRSSRTVLSRAV